MVRDFRETIPQCGIEFERPGRRGEETDPTANTTEAVSQLHGNQPLDTKRFVVDAETNRGLCFARNSRFSFRFEFDIVISLR